MRSKAGQVLGEGLEDGFHLGETGCDQDGLSLGQFAASLGQKLVGKELLMFFVFGFDRGSALLGVFVILQCGCAAEFYVKPGTCRNVRLVGVTS